MVKVTSSKFMVPLERSCHKDHTCPNMKDLSLRVNDFSYGPMLNFFYGTDRRVDRQSDYYRAPA